MSQSQSAAQLMTAAAERIAELEGALRYVVDSWSSQFERNGHLAPEWAKRARAALNGKQTSPSHPPHIHTDACFTEGTQVCGIGRSAT